MNTTAAPETTTIARGGRRPHGIELIRQIRAETDFTPIIQVMRRDNPNMTEPRANALLEAFLQWFSLLPLIRSGQTYVMLKCDVDEVFHSLIISTRFYREFCDRYIGHFIDHHPRLEANDAAIERGVHYTNDVLSEHFADALSPDLAEWRGLAATNAYSVSCRVCPDDSPMGATVEAQLPNGATLLH